MKAFKSGVALVALLASSALMAHGNQGMTYPEDGAMMMSPTEHVEMNFDMPMNLVNLKVIDSNGKPVAIDFDRTKEAKAHYKVMMPMLKPDSYTVQWKAMGGDGHMMDGSFHFMQH